MLMQAWTKSVLLNFMVEGRESADMILIHQSDHYHLHLQFLQGCKVFYNLTSTLFFFFFIFSVIIILASLQWFCTLYVESSMGFPPDFLKNAFCHVSELKSLLRSWKFVLLYHDKAAVLSLIEIVYPGSRCVGYFIIQNLISMANGFALSLQGTWIHI